MKVINLANHRKSEIKYDIFTFPDGEDHIQLHSIDRKESYYVITRITNTRELFILLQVGDILKRNGVSWNLGISYLMSMRMDRVMEFDRPFSLKIIADVINTLNFSYISILEAHSDITCKMFSNRLLSWPEASPIYSNFVYKYREDVCIVYPDKGAYKRFTTPCQYITFSKIRDVNSGKLLTFNITKDLECSNDINEFIFVDDLCDGGGTFLGELEILKKKYPNKKYSLAVTHCVQQEGLSKVVRAFNKVYTTNSYADWVPNSKLVVYEVL